MLTLRLLVANDKDMLLLIRFVLYPVCLTLYVLLACANKNSYLMYLDTASIRSNVLTRLPLIVSVNTQQCVLDTTCFIRYCRANKQLLWAPMLSHGTRERLVVLMLNVVYCNALYKQVQEID